MRFISYAQHFEDYILWRALRDVKTGFYIDVGANDPVELSVTKAFYDRGWSGINVEPLQRHYKALSEERTRDINLAVALGEMDGSIKYYEVVGDDMYSTFDETVAKNHEAAGLQIDTIEVQVTSLAKICEKYVPQSQDIHFLKVDVEGAELQVFRGMDFTKFRPWIVLAEVAVAHSPQISYEEWEKIIIDNHYEFVHFDGLNRYYLASEHKYLKKNFDYNGTKKSEYELFRVLNDEKLKKQIQSIYDDFYNTLSWKITKPLRVLKSIVKKL